MNGALVTRIHNGEPTRATGTSAARS